MYGKIHIYSVLVELTVSVGSVDTYFVREVLC